jgi:hypothetical protein
VDGDITDTMARTTNNINIEANQYSHPFFGFAFPPVHSGLVLADLQRPEPYVSGDERIGGLDEGPGSLDEGTSGPSTRFFSVSGSGSAIRRYPQSQNSVPSGLERPHFGHAFIKHPRAT